MGFQGVNQTLVWPREGLGELKLLVVKLTKYNLNPCNPSCLGEGLTINKERSPMKFEKAEVKQGLGDETCARTFLAQTF